MALFNFTIDSFGITQTRSKHEDTNFVGFTFKLGSMTPTTMFKRIGNVNNGTHQVQLSFTGMEVDQDDTCLFNYLIVNAGSANDDQVRAALEFVGAAWATGGGPNPAPPAPQMATANGIDTDWFVAQLAGIFRSSCDGVVASEQSRFQYGNLIALLPGNTYAHRTAQPGTHSPSGCGNNSQYTTNWHIAKALLLPDVSGMVAKSAVDQLHSAGFPSVKTVNSGPVVTLQTPSPGYVDAGSTIALSLGVNK